MTDWKQKYIELNKALTDLKRKKMSPECLRLIFNWNEAEFNHVSEYIAANNFDRVDRANFIKRLNKEKIDLEDLSWWKEDLNFLRNQLTKMDENNKDYKLYITLEAVLSNWIFGEVGGAAALRVIL